MMDKFRNRRRIYFIKTKFQASFIIKFCLLVIIGSLISGTIIYLMSKSTVTTSFENCRLTIKSTADFILPAVLLSGTVVILLVGLATAAIAMFTSHRIAGPLYRLSQDIQELTAGNLKKRFSVRRTDEIKALADNLDVMAQALRDKVNEIKRCFSQVQTTLQTRGGESADLTEKLENLQQALDKLDT